jgi:transposase
MQVFRRLQDEHGYRGCYGQVQRYLLKHKRRHQETFIPLAHLPGQRLEADFGHIHVDFPDGRRLVPFLVATWAYSNAPFVLALPFERTEAILAGMVAAFEFFGCIPKQG